MSNDAPLLLLGASGTVGRCFLARLADQRVTVMAVSRRPPREAARHVIWLEQDLDLGPVSMEASVLVSLGPLVHALEQIRHTPRIGRVVALSSASTLFKASSPDPEERALMARLADLEQALVELCRERGIDLTLLKPTLIYGGESDGNVSRVGELAGRLPWLPYCGRGQRQPVHADDLARLVADCLILGRRAAGTWLLGGGEVLDYPAMLARIASARGQTPRLLRVPLWVMKLALSMARLGGRLGDVRPVMLERQRVDLVVDDQAARERLGWQPRPFRP